MDDSTAYSTLIAMPSCTPDWPTDQQLQSMASAAQVIGNATGAPDGSAVGWQDIVRHGAALPGNGWNVGQVNELIAQMKILGAP